jgi:hypothetical protein
MMMLAAGPHRYPPGGARQAFIHYSLANQNIYGTFMRADLISPVNAVPETAGNGRSMAS